MLHKLVLSLCICSFCCVSFAQPGDFISFRKKNRTIKNFYQGSFLEFIHKNGSYVSGTVQRVRHDTIFMIQHDIRMMPNRWGTQSPDTLGSYSLQFHYREIAAFPKPAAGFEFIRNGTLFMIGGTGYAFLHSVNGIIQKDKIEPRSMAIAGGVALLGWGMKKMRRYYYPIGKKYKVEYISLRAI